MNIAGMIAANVVRGDVCLAHWEDLPETDACLIDVRDPKEYRHGHLEGARNLPLDLVRDRISELPKDKEIWTYCFVGQRSYYAARALCQYGFNVRNISGGFRTYQLHQAARRNDKS
ncbi:MAG: rhodanese-like domain-containing protein [Desulfobacteraceae bacterium]